VLLGLSWADCLAHQRLFDRKQHDMATADSGLPPAFAHLPLMAVDVVAPVYVAASILALALLLKPRRVQHRRWWPLVVAIATVGATLGGLLAWYVGDVQNAFGVSPTWVDRLWTGGAVAGLGVVALNLVLGRAGRRVVAAVAVVGFVLAGALAINRDAGEFVTPGQLLGTDTIPRLTIPAPSAEAPNASLAGDTLATAWHAPAGTPKKGRLGEVHISGLTSHFAARNAIVYLPPAALVADAPALPVVILMSGQPASPTTVVTSGHLPETLDALAAKHDGLAPIVVVPDQLGPHSGNPMCVDGPLGHSATYILSDVTTWITKHLHVRHDRLDWAIGGFSQGGTCALQFATAHPETFGSFIDVSGERYPTLSSDRLAIEKGFSGSVAAFDSAKPASIMAAHGLYADLFGFFAVGADDAKYTRNTAAMTKLSADAGITVERFAVPHASHDWTTATQGFAHGLAALYPRLGLGGTAATGE
jgi:enterochelin esterase-like enzyme